MSAARPGTPLLDRLMARIDAGGCCWEWTGYVMANGYGTFTIKGQGTFLAHRLVWTELVGPIPDGYDLDHLCRNRPCCDPDHLQVVTRTTNIERGIGPAATRRRAAQRTTCRRGHTYTEVNTLWRTDGARQCRACTNANARRRRAERKAAA